MELPTNTMIDTALNVVGFIAAAGAVHVVRSLFSKKEQTVMPALSSPLQGRLAESVLTGSNRHREMDFVRFREPEKTQATGNQMTTDQRRDRLDVIKMAKKMLAAGATPQRIKSVLPLSDGELAMLTGKGTPASSERAA